MKSHLCHIQLNIQFHGIKFYKELLEYMGWKVIVDNEHIVGYKSHELGSIWFVNAKNQTPSDYDSFGVNHVGLRVYSQYDVDLVQKFLEEQGVEMLFDTPRHRPEFCSDENEIYYQIMFRSPDNILFEVLYMGAKEN